MVLSEVSVALRHVHGRRERGIPCYKTVQVFRPHVPPELEIVGREVYVVGS